MYYCGQHHYQNKKAINGFFEDTEEIEEDMDFMPSLQATISKTIYTSKLGPVKVEVVPVNDEVVLLEHSVEVGGQKILIKNVNAQEHSLSEENHYTVKYLKSLSTYKMNLNDNKFFYIVKLLSGKAIAKLTNDYKQLEVLTKRADEFKTDTYIQERLGREYPFLNNDTSLGLSKYKQIYKKADSHNAAVDVLFGTGHVLKFLFKTCGIKNIKGLNAIVSICNVAGLDNAYFTGKYPVYGNGNQMDALVGLDVIAHELAHGLTNLEYKGHSGAMNESCSDIVGVSFEFYIYKLFPNLQGESDWLVGEDIYHQSGKILRSLDDPWVGKQPKKYKGKYYGDPNSSADYGHVHGNSGIPNYCYRKAILNCSEEKLFPLFVKCMMNLSEHDNFMNFRDNLLKMSDQEGVSDAVHKALDTVGLIGAVTDYGTPIPIPLPPQPTPQPVPTFPQYPQYPQQFPQFPQQFPQFPQQFPQFPQQFPQFPQQFPQFPQQFPQYPQQFPQYPQQFPQFPQQWLSNKTEKH